MKLIKPSFEIWNQPAGLEGVYKQIELAGRVSHKSEDRIKEDSSKEFVDRMIKLGHGATLEFGTVYLKVPKDRLLRNFIDNTPSHFNYRWCSINPIMDEDNNIYITTNYRHIIEHKLEDYLKYLCEPTEYHEKRVCVKFICDRITGESFLRHRVFSFMRESTRYCNYSSDKFDNELTFIIPCWCDDIPDNLHLKDTLDVRKFIWGTTNLIDEVAKCGGVSKKVSKFTQRFIRRMYDAEDAYIGLVKAGYKPQQARVILPFSVKSELVMTGFISDWKHFFNLRTPMSAHPQARELAIPLQEEFIKRGYINQ